MKIWRKNIILLALWGMDLSWLYGWAGMIMLAGFSRLYPMTGAAGLTASAALLTLVTRQRGWRYYQIFGSHLFGLILGVGAIVYGFEQPVWPWYDLAWLVEFSATPKSPGHWLLLAVAVFFSLVFWGAGIRLTLIPINHITISNHFDLGIISLVFLHLVEMVLAVKGGIILTGLSLPSMLSAFFIFSVLAFCLARCQGQGTSDFIVGFRGIGVTFSFMILLLLLGSGVIALFLPFLTAAAVTGVAVFKTISAPAGDLIIGILTFLFGSGRLRPDQAGSRAGGDAELQAASWQPTEGWLMVVQQILFYLTAGLATLMGVVLVVLVIWQLVWWLMQKTENNRAAGPSPGQMFRAAIDRFFILAIALFEKILMRTRSRDMEPVQLYRALTVWGRRNGVALGPSETPLQYGHRLSNRFPVVRGEILTIITVHDQAIYGQRLERSLLQSSRLACRRLRSPRLWPVRLRSVLFH